MRPAEEERRQPRDPNGAPRARTKALSHLPFPSLRNKKSQGTTADTRDNDVVSREEGKHSPWSQVDVQAVQLRGLC